MSCDVLTGSAPRARLEGIALALNPHEFNPRFINQFVLFLSPPSCKTPTSFVIRDVTFLFFFKTVSAEVLRISGLHAPIVRKTAFMKLQLNRGVIFFFLFLPIFSAHCLMSPYFITMGSRPRRDLQFTTSFVVASCFSFSH